MRMVLVLLSVAVLVSAWGLFEQKKPEPELWCDSYEILTIDDDGFCNVELFQVGYYDPQVPCFIVDVDARAVRGLGFQDANTYLTATTGWTWCGEDTAVRFILDGKEVMVLEGWAGD